MYKYILTISLAALSSSMVLGQYSHRNVLPGQSGTILQNGLVSEYKTSVVLDYSLARDTMFSKIDGHQDSLECIYTGMKLYMSPGQDPTEAVYLNGINNGINTEHTWPQAKGASGNAQSDMHHLYPTRTKANSDRGNNPFGDIADSQTKTWYYKATERTIVPSTGKDLYSESINSKFEPRESVKGNIARSMFYFYTMYKDQADAADPTFFQLMKSDLCRWHYSDPVDQTEWDRNLKIAKYQGDKLNPFVLDCSLVSRAYCNNIDQACEAIVLSAVSEVDIKSEVAAYPNPGSGAIFVRIHTINSTNFSIKVQNINGVSVYDSNYLLSEGQNLVELGLESSPSGFYLITVVDMSSGQTFKMPYLLLR